MRLMRSFRGVEIPSAALLMEAVVVLTTTAKDAIETPFTERNSLSFIPYVITKFVSDSPVEKLMVGKSDRYE